MYNNGGSNSCRCIINSFQENDEISVIEPTPVSMDNLINILSEIVEQEDTISPILKLEKELIDHIIECDRQGIQINDLKTQFISLLIDFPDPYRKLEPDIVRILDLNNQLIARRFIRYCTHNLNNNLIDSVPTSSFQMEIKAIYNVQDHPNPAIEEQEQAEPVNKCFMIQSKEYNTTPTTFPVLRSAYSSTHRTADNPNGIIHIHMTRADFHCLTRPTGYISHGDPMSMMVMPESFYNNAINNNINVRLGTPIPIHLIPPTSPPIRLPPSNPFVCSFDTIQQRNSSKLINRPHLYPTKTTAIRKSSCPNFNSASYRQFYNRVTEPVRVSQSRKTSHYNKYPIPRNNCDFDLFPLSIVASQNQAQRDHEQERRRMEIRHQQQLENFDRSRRNSGTVLTRTKHCLTKTSHRSSLPVSQPLVRKGKIRSEENNIHPISRKLVSENSNMNFSNNKSWHRLPTSRPLVNSKNVGAIHSASINDKMRHPHSQILVTTEGLSRKRILEVNSCGLNYSQKKFISDPSPVTISPISAQPINDPIILELIKSGAIIYNSYEEIASNAPVVPIGDGRWINISTQFKRDNINSSNSSTQMLEILSNTETISPLIIPAKESSNPTIPTIHVHPPPSFAPNQEVSNMDSLIGRNIYLVNRIIGLELQVRRAEAETSKFIETKKQRRKRFAANRKKKEALRRTSWNQVNMLKGNSLNSSHKIVSDDLAIVDSGSNLTHSIKQNHFTSLDTNDITSVEIADGHSINTEGKGKIGKYEASYTPSFNQNICGVNTLTDGGEVVCFTKARGAFTVREEDFDFNLKVNRQFTKINSMYYINLNDLKEKPKLVRAPAPVKSLAMPAVASTHPDGSIILWHQRLHMSNDYIKRLVQLNLVHGINITDADMKRQLALCESCMYSKFTRNSFYKKYDFERKKRFKISKAEAKAFKDYKEKYPLETKAKKFGKYPDNPLSPFEDYSLKNDLDEMDEEKSIIIPKFVKVKYNPLQNNLVGDIYAYIAVDLKGPFNIPGFNGEIYMMALIDAKASMQAELYLLKDKGSKTTAAALVDYVETVLIPNRKELEIHYQFSIFHNDNGNEFLKYYQQACKHYKFKQTFTTTFTPEQNSVVERYWRSLMGPTLSFMFSSKLDKRLWVFCVAFVNNVILNKIRIITYKGKVTTTWAVITSHKPDLSYLRTWGCEVFALDTRYYDIRHFSEKSFKGYFVGYDKLSNAVLVFDPINDEVITTIHVQYVEIVQGIRDVNNISVVNLNFQSVKANKQNKLDDRFESEPLHYWEEERTEDSIDGFDAFQPENGTIIGKNNTELPPVKLSKRTRDKDVSGRVLLIEECQNCVEPMDTITLGSVNYEPDYVDPNEVVLDFDLANIFYRSMYINSNNHTFKSEERITIKDAIQGPESKFWREALKVEYEGQNRLESFIICFKPDGIPLLDWILVFKRKYNDVGGILKYKVRATLRGDKQVEGADYHELYAPVGKLSSLRLFLCLVAYYKMECVQVDYKQAFLQANYDQKHEMFLTFPPFYDIQEVINKLSLDHPIRKVPKNKWKELLCLRINKTIYGLKQAPKAWYDELNNTLISLDFIPLVHEPCIFIHIRSNGEKYFMFLYVDDTLIAGKDNDYIYHLLSLIQKKHDIDIMGEPNVMLGLKLTRCPNGNIIIDQIQYCKDVAARFDLESTPNRPVTMPCTASQFRRIEEDSKNESLIDKSIDIRSMVGSLMYASLGTRPDITFFVNYISRYLTKTTQYILKIVKQAIIYLLDTPFIYITCFADYNHVPQLITFVDASHASEVNRKGVTGGILKFGKTIFVWVSTKQATYSLSTAESEYKALSEMLKETLHGYALFEEIGLQQDLPLKIYEDNTATIAMSNNPIINKKSKHIELAYHFFKSYVQKKVIQLYYISTHYQEADLFTKIVCSAEVFYSLIQKIFLLDTIVVSNRNTTLMIRSVDKPTTSERYNRIRIIYRHINNETYGYYQSTDFDIINNSFDSESNYFLNELVVQDSPFELDEIEMMAVIMHKKIMSWVKDYSNLYPGVLQISGEGNGLTIEGIRKRHESMEGFIVLHKQLKSMLRIYRGTIHEKTISIRRSDYDEIIMAHTNSDNITLMARESIINEQLTEEEILAQKKMDWLKQDSILCDELKEIKNSSSTDAEIVVLRKQAVIRATARYNNNNNSLQESISEYLKNDKKYMTTVRSINAKKIGKADKINLLNEAKEDSLLRKDIEDSIDNNSIPFNPPGRKTSRQPNVQIDYHMTTDDLQTINKQRNKKSSMIKDTIEPEEHSTHSHHHHLSNFDNKECVILLREQYPVIFSNIETQMKTTKSLLSLESKPSKRTTTYEDSEESELDYDDDFTVRDNEDEEEENFEENESNYLRLENKNNRDEEEEFDENNLPNSHHRKRRLSHSTTNPPKRLKTTSPSQSKQPTSSSHSSKKITQQKKIPEKKVSISPKTTIHPPTPHQRLTRQRKPTSK